MVASCIRKCFRCNCSIYYSSICC